jgi:hypothetical protein
MRSYTVFERLRPSPSTLGLLAATRIPLARGGILPPSACANATAGSDVVFWQHSPPLMQANGLFPLSFPDAADCWALGALLQDCLFDTATQGWL